MFAAIIGWVGTIGTFVTYVMVSRGRMVVTSVRYATLNAVGGILSGTASALYGAWPSAVANFSWALVATHTLGVCLHRRVRRLNGQVETVLVQDNSDCSEEAHKIEYVMQAPAGISSYVTDTDPNAQRV